MLRADVTSSADFSEDGQNYWQIQKCGVRWQSSKVCADFRRRRRRRRCRCFAIRPRCAEGVVLEKPTLSWSKGALRPR